MQVVRLDSSCCCCYGFCTVVRRMWFGPWWMWRNSEACRGGCRQCHSGAAVHASKTRSSFPPPSWMCCQSVSPMRVMLAFGSHLEGIEVARDWHAMRLLNEKLVGALVCPAFCSVLFLPSRSQRTVVTGREGLVLGLHAKKGTKTPWSLHPHSVMHPKKKLLNLLHSSLL